MGKGAITALVTPWAEDGEAVDYDQLRDLVEFQINEGINGLVPMGTTGESPTVSHEEHDKIIAMTVKYVNGRVPVIAGTGSNSTKEAMRLTQEAKNAGVDAVLVVNPYYNKPSQEGMVNHFKAIDSVGVPMVLYNIPGRCGVELKAETVARIYKECNNVVAIKEATGSLDMATEIASLCDITILSGDDTLTLPLMSVGAKGVVSVLSNVSPKKVLAITDNVLKGDWDSARKAHLSTFKLFKTMFIEPNPQPIKAAMALTGKCRTICRAPLTECSDEVTAKVREEMTKHNLL